MLEEKTKEVVEVLLQIEQDLTIPKNVREKVRNTIIALQSKEKDVAIKINESLQELDDVANYPNLPPYTRAQIWQIVSLLESI